MKRSLTLQLWLACSAIEGVVSVILLALIPGDPDSAWFLGRSAIRLAMIAVSVAVAASLAGLAVKSSIDPSWRGRVEARLRDWLASAEWLTAILTLLAAGVVAGAYLLFMAVTVSDPLHKAYLLRFGPWILWLALLCLTSVACIRALDHRIWDNYMHDHRLPLLAINAMLLLGAVVHIPLGNMDLPPIAAQSIMDRDEITIPIEQHDIYQVYLRGRDLLRGVNPYGKLSRTELGVQTRPSTYLPAIYYISWATQRIGFSEPGLWLDVEQGIILSFNLALAYLLFHLGYYGHGSSALGIFASIFWLFNRWTLFVTLDFQFDFLPLFMLVVSLSLLRRNHHASYLLLGLSLALKHIGIFLVPLYLIWEWQPRDKAHFGLLVMAAIEIAAIPFAASLPFIIADPVGFLNSIGYSVARSPVTHMGALSLDALLGWAGIAAKIPMLSLMALVYWIAWRGWLSRFASALLALLVFLDFNSVLFNQYVVWIVPLLLLTVIEGVAYMRMRADGGIFNPGGDL
jgi:hypothetical protein